jgi:hypothetical protein
VASSSSYPSSSATILKRSAYGSPSSGSGFLGLSSEGRGLRAGIIVLLSVQRLFVFQLHLAVLRWQANRILPAPNIEAESDQGTTLFSKSFEPSIRGEEFFALPINSRGNVNRIGALHTCNAMDPVKVPRVRGDERCHLDKPCVLTGHQETIKLGLHFVADIIVADIRLSSATLFVKTPMPPFG